MKQKIYLLVTTILFTANTFAATTLADLNPALQTTLMMNHSKTYSQAPVIKLYGGRNLKQPASASTLPVNLVPNYA